MAGSAAPLRSLADMMSVLGHSKISVLKVDAEGAEWAVLEEWLGSGLLRSGAVQQLLLEIHFKVDPNTGSIYQSDIDTLNALSNTMQLYYREDNWQFAPQFMRVPGTTEVVRSCMNIAYTFVNRST